MTGRTFAGLTTVPPYPGNNGINFETFTFTFDPVEGDGVRLFGIPGGDAHFISIGELRAFSGQGLDPDCNDNGVLDECEIAAGSGSDCQPNGVLDECELFDGDLPPSDMTELNADEWESWAQDGTITLFDDTGNKQVGAGALGIDATGGGDNYVRYPATGQVEWDLSDVVYVRAWFYADNMNGFQNQSPRIRLGNENGYYELFPYDEVLNQTVGQWTEFMIPLQGDSAWQQSVSGSPSWDAIQYIEIHADTWGAGFLSVDRRSGLRTPARPGGV